MNVDHRRSAAGLSDQLSIHLTRRSRDLTDSHIDPQVELDATNPPIRMPFIRSHSAKKNSRI